MESSWKDKFFIVAIDFGTAFSGVSISVNNDNTLSGDGRSRILVPTWKSGDQVGSAKTPTVVLLDPNRKFHSFGYEAENKFATLAENDKHQDWFYFRHFKMKLYQNKSQPPINEHSYIRDENGHEILAIEVFSHAIRFMKHKALTLLAESHVGSPDDVYFVLTCPAIWTEHSKRFMRRAARMADIESNHLRIALEPECAAVYIHSEHMPNMSASSKGAFPFRPGLTYLIVDMGGGTVDIAAHRINQNMKIEEIICPDGGPSGGINVNLKFEQFLLKLSGGEVLDKFKTENMDDYLTLLRTFEIKKTAFTMADDSNPVTISLPPSYLELHSQYNHESLSRSLLDSNFSSTVTTKREKVRIDREMFIAFFDDTVNQIIEKVKTTLRTIVGQIPTIFCVGGFSDCSVVKYKLNEAFPEHRIVVPQDAVAAIMKGATLYARDDSIIEKRVCPYTIGLDWNVDFDPKQHPADKKERVEDGYVCRDVFRKIIARGDAVITGLPVHEVRSHVKSSTQTSMEFPFYRVKGNRVPRFIDDPDCFHVGSMTVSMHDTSGGMDRYVTLKVYCDKILRAEAIDEKGKTHRVEFYMDETSV